MNTSKNILIIDGSGKNVHQLLDVIDLCEAIHLSFTHEGWQGVRNIGSEIFKALGDELKEMITHAGFIKIVVPLPAILILRILNRFNLSPIYPWVFETAAKDSYIFISSISDRLEWKSKKSNLGSMKETFNSYVKMRKSGDLDFETGHRARWNQGIRESGNHWDS